MTYDDFMTHIKVCEVLRKEPVGRHRKVNDFLTDLWEDTEIITIPESYPMPGHSPSLDIIIHRKGEYLLRMNRGHLTYSHKIPIFGVFSNLADFELFITSHINDHLKTSFDRRNTYVRSGRSIDNSLKNHLSSVKPLEKTTVRSLFKKIISIFGIWKRKLSFSY